MKIFVATSYSSKVNYETGEVFAEYRDWLEGILTTLESTGHSVFCALRADGYKINDADPAMAFQLDMDNINTSDVLFAILTHKVSAGVQTEVGAAIALGKAVILAKEDDVKSEWFNVAMQKAGVVDEIKLPLDADHLADLLHKYC